MSALPRLRPDGLAARFALLLAVALIAANLIALGLLSLQRTQQDRAALAEREAERLVSLVPAIEAAPPDRRGAIARDASTRFSAVSADPDPAVPNERLEPRSMALTQELAAALGGRTVRAAVRDRSDRDGRGRADAVVISIALRVPDGEPVQ